MVDLLLPVDPLFVDGVVVTVVLVVGVTDLLVETVVVRLAVWLTVVLFTVGNALALTSIVDPVELFPGILIT